ncbi:MAG: molybdopterin-dependent oxidoreductase [Actinomycetota bacterium]
MAWRDRVAVVRLTSRQVNLMIEALLVVSVITGLGSWVVVTAWARPLIVVHALSGLALVVVAPTKIRGPVRAGFKRQRDTRWMSAILGALVLATVALGVVHATGLWYGVGEGSALWIHLLVGFALIPLAVWHVWTRPVHPRPADLNRRALLSGTAVVGIAGAVLVGQEAAARAAGLAGGRRAGTGSHEVASFEPESMPIVSWIDDRVPDIDRTAWPLVAAGGSVAVDDLRRLAGPLEATLDCTGGWRSTQRWEVVSLAQVLGLGLGLPDGGGAGVGLALAEGTRSVRVRSATGFTRLFSLDVLDEVYLATGYGGRSLRPGHGAPVRLVAPGRRGPWWVKWVVEVEPSRRPTWLQLPFPPT